MTTLAFREVDANFLCNSMCCLILFLRKCGLPALLGKEGTVSRDFRQLQFVLTQFKDSQAQRHISESETQWGFPALFVENEWASLLLTHMEDADEPDTQK